MKNSIVVLAAFLLVMVGPTPGLAQSSGRTVLCPHTASHYAYEDNLVWIDTSKKLHLTRSAIVATVLVRAAKTEGFIYVDETGALWVSLAEGADKDVDAYYGGIGIGKSPAPISAVVTKSGNVLPSHTAIAHCPIA